MAIAAESSRLPRNSKLTVREINGTNADFGHDRQIDVMYIEKQKYRSNRQLSKSIGRE